VLYTSSGRPLAAPREPFFSRCAACQLASGPSGAGEAGLIRLRGAIAELTLHHVQFPAQGIAACGTCSGAQVACGVMYGTLDTREKTCRTSVVILTL
jgi:hypothetical protein